MKRAIYVVVTLLALCASGAGAQSISQTPMTAMPEANGVVNEFIEYNNLVIVGGGFNGIGGQTRMGLAAFDRTSGAIHAWNPDLGGGYVSDMHLVGDTLFIAGQFNSVDGKSRTQLASFDLTKMGQSDHGVTTWDPVLSNRTNVFFFGNDVQCLCSMNNTLYVGGFFGQVNSVTRGGLASFDLNNLNSNDGLTAWDPNTWTNNQQTGTGFEIWGVFNMVAHPASGNIAFSGPFEGVGGIHLDDATASPNTAAARASFAVVDGSGTGPVRNFAPSVSNAAWNDEAMAIDGDIVYHGAARSASPTAFDLTASGSPFTAFTPNTDDQAYVVGVHPSGSPVVMGGIWTTARGSSANSLLSFDSNGNVISGWDPNPDTTATTLLVTNDRVYVGGAFSTISGQSRQAIAVYEFVSAVQITTSPTLPGSTAGQSYSTQFAASGGQPGYTWSANGLPGGWNISNSGLLTAGAGAVTPGNFSFDVRVDDSGSQFDVLTCSVTIAAPALSITTAAGLPNGTAGVGYSTTLTGSGGWGSYTWTVIAGSLPSGWMFDAGSGVISASAGSVVAGTSSFTVQLADGASQQVSRVFNLVVDPAGAALNITSNPTLPAGMQGVSYSFQFAASGGQGSYTWSLIGGNLGSGWTIDNTGLLAASAANLVAGTYGFTVQVVDAITTDSLACTLVVNAPTLQITTTNLTGGVEGSPYAATIDVTGGSGGYVWTMDSGALPTGVNLNAPAGSSSAGLSGLPSAAATFNFVIRVTDNLSNTTTQAYTVVVSPVGTTPPPAGSSDSGDGGSGGGCFVSGSSTSGIAVLMLLLIGGVLFLRRRTA